MDEQRRQVLQMLAEGKITADEAERLIDALERERPESPPGAAPRPNPRPRYLTSQVSTSHSPTGSGRMTRDSDRTGIPDNVRIAGEPLREISPQRITDGALVGRVRARFDGSFRLKVRWIAGGVLDNRVNDGRPVERVQLVSRSF